jgi:hypothetical protein
MIYKYPSTKGRSHLISLVDSKPETVKVLGEPNPSCEEVFKDNG